MSSNIEVKLDVLNQKGSPALFADSLASRPAASFAGRLFVDTDIPSTGIYRDTGSIWIQVADETGTIPTPTLQTVTTAGNTSNVGISITANGIGIGTSIPATNRLDIHSASGINATFNGTGTTNSALQLQSAGVGKWTIQNNYNSAANDFVLTDVLNSVNRLQISNTGIGTLTASLSATKTATYSSGGAYGIYGNDNYTIPASTSFGSGGLIFASLQGIQNFTYGGNATYDNSALNGSVVGINQIQFSSTGTITMNQATGVRAMTAGIFQNQFLGATNGTISHLAGIEVLGVYKASTGIATITNAYGLLINNIDDYTSGFAFTNRWGIYQAGGSDNNYFAGKVVLGSTTVSTYQLDVVGTSRLQGDVDITGLTNYRIRFVNQGNSNVVQFNTNGTSGGYNGGYEFQTGGNNSFGTTTSLRIWSNNINTRVGIGNLTEGNLQGAAAQLYIKNQITGGRNAAIRITPAVSLVTTEYNGIQFDNEVLINTSGAFIGSQSNPLTTGYDCDLVVLASMASQNSFTEVARFMGKYNSFYVGTDKTLAVPSAKLQVQSTTQGFLPPRMTTAQKTAIATPATGLVVYDTTLNKLALYTGAAWETVTSV
jgi:hypothetical protein